MDIAELRKMTAAGEARNARAARAAARKAQAEKDAENRARQKEIRDQTKFLIEQAEKGIREAAKKGHSYLNVENEPKPCLEAMKNHFEKIGFSCQIWPYEMHHFGEAHDGEKTYWINILTISWEPPKKQASRRMTP